eukprot:1140225-Pelagomonas_calceolata.AAC.5
MSTCTAGTDASKPLPAKIPAAQSTFCIFEGVAALTKKCRVTAVERVCGIEGMQQLVVQNSISGWVHTAFFAANGKLATYQIL